MRLALSILLLCCLSAQAATNTAASLSYADVSAAVALCATGDTVLIPSGSANWTSALTVRKGINLIGAGSGSTFITNSIASYGTLITFALTNGTAFRVSGIYFDCNWDSGGGAIAVTTRGYQDAWKTFNYVSGFRIDNCVFDRCWYYNGNGSAPLDMWGRVWGVVDHCQFYDGVYAARIFGNPMSEAQADSYGWPDDTSGTADWLLCQTNLLYYAGTTNNFVMEDCFIGTRNPAYSPPPTTSRLAISSAWTAHYVFRFNVVSNVFDNGFNDILDLHGNKEVDGTFRGAIGAEVYGNRIYSTNNAYRFAYLRGGTCLVFSNSVYGIAEAAASLQLEEEETWNGVGPTNLIWPWVDSITNSFFWANTYNTTTAVVPQLSTYLSAAVPNAFQVGRDYWLRAPLPGDALAAYTPLTYPHPLSDGSGGGSPSTNTTRGAVSGSGLITGRGVF